MDTSDISLDFDDEMQSRASKVLANPDRLLLLCQLSQGESSVRDLEKYVGIRQPSLSQQLKMLRGENLVTTRCEGEQIYYSNASAGCIAGNQVTV